MKNWAIFVARSGMNYKIGVMGSEEFKKTYPEHLRVHEAFIDSRDHGISLLKLIFKKYIKQSNYVDENTFKLDSKLIKKISRVIKNLQYPEVYSIYMKFSNQRYQLSRSGLPEKEKARKSSELAEKMNYILNHEDIKSFL